MHARTHTSVPMKCEPEASCWWLVGPLMPSPEAYRLPPPADEYKLPEDDCGRMGEALYIWPPPAEVYMLSPPADEYKLPPADEYKLPWTTLLPLVAMLHSITRSVQVQNV